MSRWIRVLLGTLLLLSVLYTGQTHNSPAIAVERLPQDVITTDGLAAPLTPTPGDPGRGRQIVEDRERGDCVVCHQLPLPERHFHGTVGPPLDTVGQRLTIEQLRLQLVNPKRRYPHSVMPAYFSTSGLHRVIRQRQHHTLLSAQEIEDVIAYLQTLTGEDTDPKRQGVVASVTSDRKEGSTQQRTTPPPTKERLSGYAYLSEESQGLQNDPFANPGMLWVERGKELWEQREGHAQQSCASCHKNAAISMRGVSTHYPRFDSRRRKLINLEQQINRCRTQRQHASPYAYESDQLLALTTFISFQSRDLPMRVKITGPARRFFLAGRSFFMQRRGQLDLACSHCHDLNAGQRLRGDVISQGHVNGFPIYRNLWQTLGSRHRMFAWCNSAIRAEPFALGSDTYVNLELYMAWRADGLAVESPAIRR